MKFFDSTLSCQCPDSWKVLHLFRLIIIGCCALHQKVDTVAVAPFVKDFKCNYSHTKVNKKVLLRERKRHTTHNVGSARYAALSPDLGGGGGPPSSANGGYPHPVLMGRIYHHQVLTGVPPSRFDWGTPSSSNRVFPGVPPSGRMAVPPSGRMVVPPVRTGWGYPPPGCGLTHKLRILPSPSFGCGR